MIRVAKILTYVFAIIGFILVLVYIAVELGLTKTPGIIDNQRNYFKNQLESEKAWANTEEWSVLKEAIEKDRDTIEKVSKETKIPSRLIITPLVVEQLRLFYSNREIFKQVFAPLKILGNQSQFSWGIMGIKQKTAMQIENRLKDIEEEHILDFKTNNPDKERFERLTDENNRYYSYLYAALYIKELINQWQKAGFPIENSPDIIATLFNIGFENSKPHSNPLSGGAKIEIDEMTYSFGSLAKSFYNSNELIKEFPKNSL